jgi:hypothetical protein
MKDKITVHKSQMNEFYVFQLSENLYQARTKDRIPVVKAASLEQMAATMKRLFQGYPYILYLNMV